MRLYQLSVSKTGGTGPVDLCMGKLDFWVHRLKETEMILAENTSEAAALRKSLETALQKAAGFEEVAQQASAATAAAEAAANTAQEREQAAKAHAAEATAHHVAASRSIPTGLAGDANGYMPKFRNMPMQPRSIRRLLQFSSRDVAKCVHHMILCAVF